MPHTTSMQLAFVGTCNWDLYLNQTGSLYAIPKPNAPKDCRSTWFGDKNHVRNLMQELYFDDTPTDIGLALLEGLSSRFPPLNTKKPHADLNFISA